jgi:hypothetical protein
MLLSEADMSNKKLLSYSTEQIKILMHILESAYKIRHLLIKIKIAQMSMRLVTSLAIPSWAQQVPAGWCTAPRGVHRATCTVTVMPQDSL